MIQQALNFNPARGIPGIKHRSYGGWTPSQWRETSIQAAESMEPFAVKAREKVLMAITRLPGANHQIGIRIKMKLQSVCARVAELREDGLIEDSGRRCRTDSNRPAIIWSTTPLGEKIGWALIRSGRKLS